MMEIEEMMHRRSRFRGVYKCGLRWKAQLQRQGIQYYLGIFDTEVEAAHAYDKKAREDESGTMLTNFNEDGTETFISSSSMTVKKPANKYAPSSTSIKPDVVKNINGTTTTASADGSSITGTGGENKKRKKKQKTDSEFISDQHNNSSKGFGTTDGGDFSFIMRLENPGHVRSIWERHSSISQRLLIAKAARDQLIELQRYSPDEEKMKLLMPLIDEIALLGLAKTQLEECLERAVAQGLASNNHPVSSVTTLPIPVVQEATSES